MSKLVLEGFNFVFRMSCTFEVSTRHGTKTLFMCVIQIRQLGVSKDIVAEDLNQVDGYLA